MNNNQGTSKVNQSINNLHFEGNLTSFRKTLRREILEYENRVRKSEPFFDVYEFLGEKLNYNPTSIRKWFNDYDQSGTKLGVADLELICLYLNTDRPIKALLYDIQSSLPNQSINNLKDSFIESLKSKGLSSSYLVGELCNSIITALDIETPGIITNEEKAEISNSIEILTNQLKELNQQINKAN